MARATAERRSDRVEPGQNKLPYQDHPLYILRKVLIIIDLVGILLSFFSAGPFDGAPFGSSILFLAISIFFAVADLTQYAMKKVQNPNEEPEWPKLQYIVVDLILAIVIQLCFWATVGVAEYRYSGTRVLSAYAALCNLLCSITHFYTFWKQLIARYKKRWLKTLVPVPCSRCGYLDPSDETEDSQTPFDNNPPNIHPYAGPSASFPKASAAAPPQASEIMMEEGLLIGSDFGGSTTNSYGTIETPDMTIDKDERVVVSKGKKKKAVMNKEGQAERIV